MQTLVSTENIDPHERFEFWVSEMSRMMLVSLDTRSSSSAHFHGTARTNQIGDLQLSSLTAGAVRVARTARLTNQREEDFYKVALQVSGTALIEQDDQRCRLEPGDLVFCDTARPYSFTYEDDFHTVLVVLPHQLISLPPNALRALAGRRIGVGEGTSAVVAPFLRSLVDHSDTIVDTAVSRLVDGTASLITALLSEQLASAVPAMSQPAVMVRVRDHIERKLSDPHLSPDSIADALGISRRYLFKLFAAENTTVSGWIRHRRLERCARDLADPAARHQPIGLIAARWGLLDDRHFARLFKAGYGHTPRAYRQRALESQTGSGT